MRYALNLSDDGRILSATYLQYAQSGAVKVDELPEGNINDYLYLNSGYVYDPLPVPEEPEQPTPVDYEARIAALEEQLAAAKIILGVD